MKTIAIFLLATTVLLGGCGTNFAQKKVKCYKETEQICGKGNVEDTDIFMGCSGRCKDYTIVK